MFKLKCSTCGKTHKAINDKFVIALTNDKKEITGYVCVTCERKAIRKHLIKKYKIVENGIPFQQQLQTAMAEELKIKENKE
jgi:hypothetical protein